MCKIIKSLSVFLLVILVGCKDFLNVIPDNVATLDHAFVDRNAAEKFLFGCFNYWPNEVNYDSNPAIFGSDEYSANVQNFGTKICSLFGKGEQYATNPYFNYWDGVNGGKCLWIGIRDCNIFLENIDKPVDLEESEKRQWIAEIKFTKAYLHYYLFQLYGPIPIVDKNLPMSSDPDQVRVFRNSVDEVVDYIANLLDEAARDLPLDVEQPIANAGRPTKIMALALKAKLLTLAASPLFNDNPDYADFADKKGKLLFQSTIAPKEKWARAATALKAAIDTAHLANKSLYNYVKIRPVSDTTALLLTIRGTVTEKWNQEVIWGSTFDIANLQKNFATRFRIDHYNSGTNHIGVSLKIAELFYSNNGIPINEDPAYDYSNRYKTKMCVPSDGHFYYIKEYETTARLNFNREPRFYASLGFDRGIYEGAGVLDDKASLYVQARKTEAAGMRGIGEHQRLGYYNKKVVHYETAVTGAAVYQGKRYAFPLIRLADLYLLYAEALNEVKDVPDNEVYEWIDKVRERAGIKGVVQSWSKSINPSKPTTKMGMRQIIQQERLIELAGEFQRYWDLRRWKLAVREFNKTPVQGWNYLGETAEDYYNVQNYLSSRSYLTRDYLWPLKNEAILENPNLAQNPGW